MRARRFTKRVEVFQVGETKVPDGFGGYTVSSSKITDSWAKIKSFQPNKFNNISDFGDIDIQNSLLIELRKRTDITYNADTMFIKYLNTNYSISSAPINVNHDNKSITFVMTKITAKKDQSI